ncbi:phage integrase family protein with SAM-like domain [Saliterribacillus persicus]|uniref:Phage integrase family protein with SAM-like domain n=1 Tax=Saliterribacillus persicus TaxID=930114 RepID=A0A368YA68_9BACI|nr:phage integrase family protein with SAM-like domain [Saliterribacillus persicus]
MDNSGKAPNTIKTYRYHLKLFYEFMSQRGIGLEELKFKEMSNFVGWLSNPTEEVKVIDLKPKKAKLVTNNGSILDLTEENTEADNTDLQ